jgi:hypothetical protein
MPRRREHARGRGQTADADRDPIEAPEIRLVHLTRDVKEHTADIGRNSRSSEDRGLGPDRCRSDQHAEAENPARRQDRRERVIATLH